MNVTREQKNMSKGSILNEYSAAYRECGFYCSMKRPFVQNLFTLKYAHEISNGLLKMVLSAQHTAEYINRTNSRGKQCRLPYSYFVFVRFFFIKLATCLCHNGSMNLKALFNHKNFLFWCQSKEKRLQTDTACSNLHESQN